MGLRNQPWSLPKSHRLFCFQRKARPRPCHVKQDISHSRVWSLGGHSLAFRRAESAFQWRNHDCIPENLMGENNRNWPQLQRRQVNELRALLHPVNQYGRTLATCRLGLRRNKWDFNFFFGNQGNLPHYARNCYGHNCCRAGW